MHSALAKPCLVCGLTVRTSVVSLEPDWRVSRCRGCGLHTLSPEPEDVALEAFEDGSGYEDAFGLRDDIVARYRVSLASVERFAGPGRLLDVGCGGGFMLEAARERGWTAVGVDPSSYAVARARKMGHEAHEGLVQDLELPEGEFDAVALLQVVEHVTDPRPLLAASRRALRPGGALLVATPNPRSLLARAKRERFNYWIPPVHCVWYTPRALARLLRSSGFAPVVETTWSPRAFRIHDGMDVLDQTRWGRRLPYRVKRWTGGALIRLADLAGCGTMTEQVALRWNG